MNVLLAALLAFFALMQTVSAGDVSIMSFNIDCRFCDFHKEHADNFRDRVDNELDTIARHDPDIIGIEEPIFSRDVQMLTPRGYSSLFYDQAKFLPWGTYPDATILYKTNRFRSLEFGQFWLGPNASEPRGYDRPRTPRLAVYSLMEDKQDGTRFYFGATHFDHGDDLEGRDVDCVMSAHQLLETTAPLAAKYPFIWVGDFNSKTANNNAYSILTNTSADFHLVDSYFHSPTHEVVHNQETEPSYDYNNSIDHIFYANNDHVAQYTVSDWAVDMYLYGEKQQYASDHYAIYSVVNIKQL